MEPSNFLEWVDKYFPGLVIEVVTTLNGDKSPRTYLHKQMLRKEFSVTGKWESISINDQIVAADFVAFDSSLPLKKRPTFGRASGEIPKQGVEFKLNEQQLTDLDTLVALGAPNELIVARLLQDIPKAIGAIYEKNEAAFLQGLSTGITIVQDDKNTGTGIRLDFGYKAENKFKVDALWSSVTSKPFDDLEKLQNKASADGNAITKYLLDRPTMANLAKADQTKELAAYNIGFVGSNIPTPDLNAINQMAKNRFGFIFQVVDRSVITQKNGVNTSWKPWGAGQVIGIGNDIVGSLTWARLAEMNHPTEGVRYQTADDYILVSQYRKNEPSLSEIVSSQARVVPVISNVDAIYSLDTLTAEG